MKGAILLIPLILTGSVLVRAQNIGPSTVNSAGNTALIGGNQFDWSVGEMSLVSTFTTPGIIVTQGVLQPSETDHTGVPVAVLSKDLRVFPNPASSVVNLQYNTQSAGRLTYSMMDITGKTITKKTVSVNPGITTEQINISELACATYMLKVSLEGNNMAKDNISYKIEKLK